jgi:transposase-like protein
VDTRTESAEPKVRAAYQPGISIRDLAAAAGVSSSAASKWRKVILAERAQQVAQ